MVTTRSSRSLLASLATVMLGCGSAAGTTPDAGSGDDGGRAPDAVAEAGGDAIHLSTEGGNDAVPGDGGTCATDHAATSPIPAYLVFLMDHSNSMKKDSKWDSCSAALESFFTSKNTTSLSASLTWLPFVPSGKGAKYSCDESDYETPAVPMTALPATEFKDDIKAQVLQQGTPTLPALQGTVVYAQAELAAHPKEKVLIVLATDGKPQGCTGNTVTAVADEAATAFAAGIPTFVIGVGSETTNLDAIAASGGTGSALIVSTSDPKTTTKDFEAAIATIQAGLACEYAIPSPTGGQEIDYSKVNVDLTDAKGNVTELTYSSGCTDTDGWHYDSVTDPTLIVLCSAACTDAQASASVDITFGCKTNGVIK